MISGGGIGDIGLSDFMSSNMFVFIWFFFRYVFCHGGKILILANCHSHKTVIFTVLIESAVSVAD